MMFRGMAGMGIGFVGTRITAWREGEMEMVWHFLKTQGMRCCLNRDESRVDCAFSFISWIPPMSRAVSKDPEVIGGTNDCAK